MIALLSGPVLRVALPLVFPSLLGANRLDDDELLQHARDAVAKEEWLLAAEWLFAYVHRNPPEMNERDFEDRILATLSDVEWNATCSVAVVGGEKAGVRSVNVPIPRPGKVPKSSPLRCRGGGGMSLDFHPRSDSHLVTISFRKAASPVKVQPGECTWVDHPVRADEPSFLELEIRASEGVQRVKFRLAPRDSKHSLGGTLDFLDVKDEPIKRLLTNFASDDVFVVNVHNDGKRLRVVESKK